MGPWVLINARWYYMSLVSAYEGLVKLTDCGRFSAFLHEAKPLKLRREAIDKLPRFRSESD